MAILKTNSTLCKEDGRIKLKKAIRQHGFSSIRDLALQHELDESKLGLLVQGHKFRFYQNNELNPFIAKLMVILNRRLDELVDEEEYLDQELEDNRPLGRAETVFAETFPTWDTDRYMAEQVDDRRLKATIDALIEPLTPRARKCIIHRFGLEGEVLTLEEIGVLFDVSRERIRQIEAKALRQLRHPTRSEKLREFLDPDAYVRRNFGHYQYTLFGRGGERWTCVARDGDKAQAMWPWRSPIALTVYGDVHDYRYDEETTDWYRYGDPTPKEALALSRTKALKELIEEKLRKSRTVAQRIEWKMEIIGQWMQRLVELAEKTKKGHTTVFTTGLPTFAVTMKVFEGRISEPTIQHGVLGRRCMIAAMVEWIEGLIQELHREIAEMANSIPGLVYHGNRFYEAGTEPQVEELTL